MSVPYETLLRRDPCSYCGAPGGILDHIIPRVEGGDENYSNLTGSCRSCNSGKSDRSVLSWMVQLTWLRPLQQEVRTAASQWVQVGRKRAFTEPTPLQPIPWNFSRELKELGLL